MLMFGNLQSAARRWVKLVLFLLWILLWYVPFYIVYHGKLPIHGFCVKLFSRGILFILGVKVKVNGDITTQKPVLFVANHASYFDIFVLASVLPAVFIAKDEIPNWPVIGPLTRFSGSVYISRKMADTAKNMEAIKKCGRSNFILFPEGTTSDGNRVKKFNSAFLELAKNLSDKPMAVQPVTVAYTRICNIAMGNHYRPYFAWFGDMELAPHAADSLSFGGITAEVTLHEIAPKELLNDRKKLATYCENVISDEMGELLTGRRKSAKTAA